MATNNIQVIQQWCEEARKLLKTKSGKVIKTASKESDALKKYINSVAKLLQKLTADPSLSNIYIPFQERFQQLALEMQKLSGEVNQARGKDDDKKNVAQAKLNTSFQSLENDIKEVLPVVDARRLYMADYDKTLQAVQLMAVQECAQPEPLEKELAKIHDQCQQNTVDAYGIGQKALKALMVKVDKEREDAKKRKELADKQKEKQPECGVKLETARNFLSEIEDLVGVEATAKKYRDIILAAEELCKTGKYRDAITKLEELKALPKIDQIKKDSDQQVQTLKELPGYQKGEECLAALKALMPSDDLQALEQEFKQAGNAFLQEGNVKNKVQQAFAAVVKKLEETLKTRQTQLADVERLSTVLTNLYQNLADISNPINVLEDKVGFDDFVTWRAGKMLPQAVGKGLQLEFSISAKLDNIRQAKDEWTQAKGELDKIYQGLLALNKSPCKAVEERSKGDIGKINKSDITYFEEQREWSSLTRRLAVAKQALTELQQMHDDFDGLAQPREQAHAQVEEKRKSLLPAIENFDKAVVDRCGQEGLPAYDAGKQFVTLVDGVMQTWNQAKVKATTDNDLNNARELALTGLADIEERLAQANTPEGIKNAVGDHDQDLTQPAFEKAWAEFERLQLQSQSLDNTTAKKLAKQGQDVRKMAPPDWKGALLAITELNAQAKGDVEVAGNAQAGLQQTIIALGNEVLTAINQAKAGTENAEAFEGTFKALMDEHAELLLLGQSNNIDALQEAEQGLKDLQLRASKLQVEQKGTGTPLDFVYKQFEKLEADLKEARPGLEKNEPQALVRLTEAWVSLKAEIFSMEPSAAQDKLLAFTKQFHQAEVAAEKVVAIRGQYDEMLPSVEKLLKELTDAGSAPEYAKQLQARLKEAKKKAGAPGTLYEALTSLQVLNVEVFEARTNRDKALLKEKGVVQAKHQDEQLLTTYERTRKICEDKYVKEAKAAVDNSDGDTALPKELSRMLDMAKQTFKQGDVAKALQQVELTIERAKQIIANPYGPAIGSRNDLPKDKQVWQEAIVAFKLSLDGLRDVTLIAAGDIHEAAKSALTDMLDELKLRFDPLAFDTALHNLMDTTMDAGKRRAAREAALAVVHSNQAILSKHPYVKKLLANPAAKGQFSLGYRRMQSALTRLEANISRCVR